MTKLGPIIDLEIVCEPQGSRTEGGLTAGSQIIEHGRRLRRAGRGLPLGVKRQRTSATNLRLVL